MSKEEIDGLFLKNDESYLWPINSDYNVTKKDIENLEKLKEDGLDLPDGGVEYAYMLDKEISDLVNSESESQIQSFSLPN